MASLTVTGIIPEGGTAEKKLPSTPHGLINGLALIHLGVVFLKVS